MAETEVQDGDARTDETVDGEADGVKPHAARSRWLAIKEAVWSAVSDPEERTRCLGAVASALGLMPPSNAGAEADAHRACPGVRRTERTVTYGAVRTDAPSMVEAIRQFRRAVRRGRRVLLRGETGTGKTALAEAAGAAATGTGPFVIMNWVQPALRQKRERLNCVAALDGGGTSGDQGGA